MYNKLKTTAKITGGDNIRIDVMSISDNVNSGRIPNYFPQLVGFRLNQLAITS